MEKNWNKLILWCCFFGVQDQISCFHGRNCDVNDDERSCALSSPFVCDESSAQSVITGAQVELSLAMSSLTGQSIDPIFMFIQQSWCSLTESLPQNYQFNRIITILPSSTELQPSYYHFNRIMIRLTELWSFNRIKTSLTEL